MVCGRAGGSHQAAQASYPQDVQEAFVTRENAVKSQGWCFPWGCCKVYFNYFRPTVTDDHYSSVAPRSWMKPWLGGCGCGCGCVVSAGFTPLSCLTVSILKVLITECLNQYNCKIRSTQQICGGNHRGQGLRDQSDLGKEGREILALTLFSFFFHLSHLLQ